MKKVLDGFAKLIEIICVVIMVIMVVVIFLATLGRYSGLFAIPWSEECARYCMVVLVYLGLMIASRNGGHFVVEVMPMIFSKKPAILNAINIVVALCVDAFGVFMAYQGYRVAAKLLSQGKQSPMMNLPLGVVYMVIPVGVVLMAIFFTIHTFENLKKKEAE